MDYEIKKISEFPENEQPLTADCILVEHNPAFDGTAKKMTLSQLLQFMNIKSEAHPAGTMYIQFKGEKTPSELFGGTWYNVSSEFAGMFFRAEGGNAAAFGSDQEQSVQAHTHTIDHTHTRGTMNITSDIGNSNFLSIWTTANNISEATSKLANSPLYYTEFSDSYKVSIGVSGNFARLKFDASRNWTGSTSTPSATNSGSYGGTETRPVNSTIRIWRRAY